jgi:metal-responsive CopG/Arc/MetJ family transcriptional regulator
VKRKMRHIFTISVNPDLEKELDDYQKAKGYETRSEGAIQLMKKGLLFEKSVNELKAENEKLRNKIEDLKNRTNSIHLPCSICGNAMEIKESDDDLIYSDIKKRYKNWAHSSCIKNRDKNED